METPASVKKHPLHPMLIGIPIGLWLFSLVCDALGLLLPDATFSIVAFYTMVGGLVGALAAAIPGVIDFLSLGEGTRAKKIALWHMGLNIAIMTSYAINIGLRVPDITAPPGFAVGLSAIAIGLLAISGWLGAELVHVLGIGVADSSSAGIKGGAGAAPDDIASKKRPVS